MPKFRCNLYNGKISSHENNHAIPFLVSSSLFCSTHIAVCTGEAGSSLRPHAAIEPSSDLLDYKGG